MTQYGRACQVTQFACVGEMVGMPVGDHDQSDVLRIDLQTREQFLIFLLRGWCASVDENRALFLDEF